MCYNNNGGNSMECDVNDTDNYKDYIELVEELEKKTRLKLF